MLRRKFIYVISSYSIDIVKYLRNNKISIRKWGPLYFFEKYVNRSNVDLELKFLNLGFCIVEIERTAEEEYWTILLTKQLEKFKFKEKDFDNLLISFIKDEFSFIDINWYKAKNLFVDIQWYYRVLKWECYLTKDLLPQYDNLFIKATEEEFNILDNSFKQEVLKQQVVLITRGNKWVFLSDRWKKYEMLPNRIVNCKDTIGAGDTFFISFVWNWLENWNIISATREAMIDVENFLSNKDKESEKDKIFNLF